MGRLNNILIDSYADHYARVNTTTNPLSASARNIAAMQSMFGDLIDPLPAGSRVLDLGCGTGIMLYWLSMHPNIAVVGVDSSHKQVEIARQGLPDIDIICDDGLQYLKRHRDTFAGIFCTDVLEHLESSDLCLDWVEEACSALKLDGFFCCR